MTKFGISNLALKLGIQSLEYLSFTLRYSNNAFQITWQQEQPSRAGLDTDVAVTVKQLRSRSMKNSFIDRDCYAYQLKISRQKNGFAVMG